jgi:hypothetical protein
MIGRSILPYLILIVSFLTSCYKIQLYKDSKIASEILSEAECEGGKIYYTEDKMTINERRKYFVEININKCKLISKGLDKNYVASYCATQLYKRLNPSTIEKNYGINVIFDGEEDITGAKPYFFEKSELKLAWQAFDNITKFIQCSINDTICLNTYVDTTFYHLTTSNLIEIKNGINKKVGSKVIELNNFYTHLDLKIQSNTKSDKCFAISCFMMRPDSTNTIINFLCPMYETQNKIINFDLQL